MSNYSFNFPPFFSFKGLMPHLSLQTSWYFHPDLFSQFPLFCFPCAFSFFPLTSSPTHFSLTQSSQLFFSVFSRTPKLTHYFHYCCMCVIYNALAVVLPPGQRRRGQLPGQPDAVVPVWVPQERCDVARGPVLHPAEHGHAAGGSLRRPGGQRLLGMHLRRLSWRRQRCRSIMMKAQEKNMKKRFPLREQLMTHAILLSYTMSRWDFWGLEVMNLIQRFQEVIRSRRDKNFERISPSTGQVSVSQCVLHWLVL